MGVKKPRAAAAAAHDAEHEAHAVDAATGAATDAANDKKILLVLVSGDPVHWVIDDRGEVG